MKTKPKGLDRPSTTRIIKVMSAAHTRMYRATGGRLGKNWRVGSAVRQAAPVCLLTTTGRKSGRPHTVPLIYLQDGPDIVVGRAADESAVVRQLDGQPCRAARDRQAPF
jgi:hypothetical protein